MPKWAPANNDVPSVADLVAYIADQVISQVTAASRPTGTDGEVIYETDTTRFQAYEAAWIQFGGLTSAAFNSHTPQLDQGASTNIAKTVNYSKYQRIGNLCWWSFNVSVTGSGTAGSIVTLTTPVTMDSTVAPVGAGRLFDSSTGIAYSGTWFASSTTTVRLFVDVTGSSAWGATPNLGLASGDSMAGVAWLPVA